jgi:hypothetical protein
MTEVKTSANGIACVRGLRLSFVVCQSVCRLCGYLSLTFDIYSLLVNLLFHVPVPSVVEIQPQPTGIP